MKRPIKKRRSFFRRLPALLFRFFTGAFLLSLLYLFLCKWILPPLTLTQLANRLQGQQVLYLPVPSEAVSAEMKLALLAAEDQLFPSHSGFDWKALDKSLHGKRHTGIGTAASTISQQTAKNVFLWQGKGASRYVRKALEVPYTWLIEKIWGKRRILEVYLNIAQTGPGLYGVEAAAQTFFDKPAQILTAAEAAQIAAPLPNPVVLSKRPLRASVWRKALWIRRQMPILRTYPAIRELIR